VTGLGPFEAVQAQSGVLTLFGRDVYVLDLDGLERSKRAAGRAKDLLDLELVAALKRES
jgi:hypothetical protein